MTAPTRTVSPSPAAILISLPSNGEGISALTLSVTTSTRGSSRLTMSPSCLSHLSTVPSVTDSPSWGILICEIGIGTEFTPPPRRRCVSSSPTGRPITRGGSGLEATPRIELGMEVLQTSALPLGYVAA